MDGTRSVFRFVLLSCCYFPWILFCLVIGQVDVKRRFVTSMPNADGRTLSSDVGRNRTRTDVEMKRRLVMSMPMLTTIVIGQTQSMWNDVLSHRWRCWRPTTLVIGHTVDVKQWNDRRVDADADDRRPLSSDTWSKWNDVSPRRCRCWRPFDPDVRRSLSSDRHNRNETTFRHVASDEYIR